MKKFKKIKLAMLIFLVIVVMNFLTGCGLLLVGGLAGTGGYLAAKHGYGVQSPVTHKSNNQ
ncbi:MAG: hypothetical protein EVG15_04990 [Candidatus Acididesulfobacter diazotrophicus]|jgi:hypothetical protein|uniref:Lipoprotein n=1 Tax=Candidatus Acididesulfobacter diazotrophicus TaxID=2597226 RepID=A0A519BN92_9DELT|nr:MAG: hypothetical protein EVG15_04990 [Candidatus Acididesulfobacter diazotrophicus]